MRQFTVPNQQVAGTEFDLAAADVPAHQPSGEGHEDAHERALARGCLSAGDSAAAEFSDGQLVQPPVPH
nr:hypothetical protein [Streptomyces sp. NRRL S-646]